MKSHPSINLTVNTINRKLSTNAICWSEEERAISEILLELNTIYLFEMTLHTHKLRKTFLWRSTHTTVVHSFYLNWSWMCQMDRPFYCAVHHLGQVGHYSRILGQKKKSHRGAKMMS